MAVTNTQRLTEGTSARRKDDAAVWGLWQLNGNGKVNNFEDVVKLDCEYIDNWSFVLDFKIIAGTVTKVVRGDG